MKKFSVLTSVMFGFVTASLQAGTEVYKQVAPPPPPELYGLGFYGAIDAGANVYQNRGGDRTFTDDNLNSPFFGDSRSDDSSRMPAPGSASIMRNPRVPSSKALMGRLPLAAGEVTLTSRGRLLPAQITIGPRNSVPLLNTT